MRSSLFRGARGLRLAPDHDDLGPSTSAPTQIALWPTPLSPRHARRLAAQGNPRAQTHDVRTACVASASRQSLLCYAYSKRPKAASRNASQTNTKGGGGNGFGGVRRSKAGSRRAPPGENAAAVQFGERVVPLLRKAERDLLPGGQPNTPWRRLAYELRLAPEVADLLPLIRGNLYKDRVWGPHHTALTLTRLASLLYPKAVASGTADGAGGDSPAGVPPTPALKTDAHTLYQILSDAMNKNAIRQVQGFSLARLCVAMAWTHSGSGLCLALVEEAVRELCRPGGRKLAQVAALDPPLFARLVRALAQLVPYDDHVWVELQRLTLAALLQALADSTPATGSVTSGGGGSAGEQQQQPQPGSQRRRLWGPALDDRGRPLPDCSVADLASMAFGFAAAGRTAPPVFDALRSAALAGELPADADALASLLWAWARAQLPPGYLAPRVLEAFWPLLPTAHPRPIGRLLWSLAALGLRNPHFLAAAGSTIVSRKLLFGSPQELVNVVWAFSQLGVHVGEEEAERMQAQERQQQLAARSGGAGGAQAAAAAATAAAAAARRGCVQRDEGSQQQQQREEDEDEAGADTGGSGAYEAGAIGRVESVDVETATGAAAPWEAGDGTPCGSERHTDERHSDGFILRSTSSSSGSSSLDESAGPRHGPLSSSTAATDTPGGDSPSAGPSSDSADSFLIPPPRPKLPPPRSFLQPLPLAAVATALEARRVQVAAQPPLDPSSPLALYRFLALCFLECRVSSTGLKWTMSDAQLAVLAASFARAKYGNKPLFHTMGRMAMRRFTTLKPPDLALLLWAHAQVRVRNDSLVLSAAAVAERRWQEFSPRQLADVMWAVQVLQPRAVYLRLAEALRRQRLAAEAAAAPSVQRDAPGYGEASQVAQGGVAAGPASSPTVPAVIRPLHVPPRLLLGESGYAEWREELKRRGQRRSAEELEGGAAEAKGDDAGRRLTAAGAVVAGA